MSDSDIDDAAHEVLLQSITAQTSKKVGFKNEDPENLKISRIQK